MKRLLCAVAAIALIAPAAGAAQPQNGRHEGNRAQRESRAQRENRQAHHQGQYARGGHQRAEGRAMENRRGGREQANRSEMSRNRGDYGRRMNHERAARAEAAREVYRPGHRPATYHRIRAPEFRYPGGYRYRRWGVGAVLPRIFLAQPYYWTDWRALGLLPPPPGFIWVRFGPDLLLVNRYTGRIADVIYGAFY